MFIPYYDKIEVEPFKPQNKVIKSEEQGLIEVGKVISVGEHVTFVKPGDVIYFDSWGCSKTPDFDGKIHYIVSTDNSVILGKQQDEKQPV